MYLIDDQKIFVRCAVGQCDTTGILDGFRQHGLDLLSDDARVFFLLQQPEQRGKFWLIAKVNDVYFLHVPQLLARIALQIRSILSLQLEQ